jgi:uncharacterized protein (DUF1800 family)
VLPSNKLCQDVNGEIMGFPDRRRRVVFAKGVSITLTLGLLTSSLITGVNANSLVDKNQRLNDDQKIIHVLNRLGFGARPGDVERVRQMGLDKYIELQLNPERIPDAVANDKVKDLEVLSMTTAELYEKYPQPGQLLRQLQKRNDLPPELAAAVKQRGKGPGAAQGAPPVAVAQDVKNDSEMKDASKDSAAVNDNPKPDDVSKNGKDDEYRKAIRDYYIQNNLQQPQKIVQELQASRILRAVYSERQLQEEMVDFWSNHFNIFAGKGADRWLLVSYDRDTIRPNVMGRFEDLLKATAQSPAMLFYLDNFQSVSPNAQGPMRRPNQVGAGRGIDLLPSLGRNRRRGYENDPIMRPQQQQIPQAQIPRPQNKQNPKRGINENYARELMELHTLGVDGGYTQKDVQEVARCFTGWTIFAPRGAVGPAGRMLGGNLAEQAGKFYFNTRLHDDGEKTVLGHKIPAGGGVKDGYMVLDILAHHPSTAKFIATKLARTFVMDNPSPELVNRISGAFLKSDGDIRQTLRAIFTSTEFNSPAAYRAKIKTPFELSVSAVRALGGETNGGPGFHQWIAKMGQPLYGYQAPTGYPDSAENWVNTGALLERLNFGLALASNRIPGTRVNLPKFNPSSPGDVNSERARILDRFLDVIVQGDISEGTRKTILKQLDQPLPVNATASAIPNAEMDPMAPAGQQGQRRARRELAMNNAPIGNPEVVKIVGLILGSPEFQRQ